MVESGAALKYLQARLEFFLRWKYSDVWHPSFFSVHSHNDFLLAILTRCQILVSTPGKGVGMFPVWITWQSQAALGLSFLHGTPLRFAKEMFSEFPRTTTKSYVGDNYLSRWLPHIYDFYSSLSLLHLRWSNERVESGFLQKMKVGRRGTWQEEGVFRRLCSEQSSTRG